MSHTIYIDINELAKLYEEMFEEMFDDVKYCIKNKMEITQKEFKKAKEIGSGEGEIIFWEAKYACARETLDSICEIEEGYVEKDIKERLKDALRKCFGHVTTESH